MIKTIFTTTLLLAIALGPCRWVSTGWQANRNTVPVPLQVPSRPSSPEGIIVDEAPLSPEGIDKAVEALRKSVRSLELCIKRHHLRRNSLLPLFSLPPEILEHIFLLAVPFPGHRAALFSLGLVCSWWQDVVSRSGRLWSNVLDINDDHRWVQMVLERSAQVPLSIHARVMAPYDEEASRNLIVVLRELPRIHTLNIQAPCQFIRVLLPHLSLPSPTLHTFSLNAACGSPPNDLILPSTLFASYAANIRRFEVRNCDFDITMLKGWRLTHLTISDLSVLARPLRNELLDALEHLPLLQELTLSRAISSDLSSPSRYTQVHLSHLRQLHLQGDFSACFDFLPWVVFPTTASLNFSWTCSGEIALPLIDSSSIRELLEPNLRELRCDTLEFTALPHEIELECSHNVHSQYFRFICDIRSSTATQTSGGIRDIIIASFDLPMPLHNITTWSMDVSLPHPLSESAWSHIISKFQSLREIACYPPPPGFLGCLAANAERAIAGHEVLLLPSLVGITFQGVSGERRHYRALKRLRRKIKWRSP